MKRFFSSGALALLITLQGVGLAQSASLQVAPVRLEIPPGGAASKINLKNLGNAPIATQIRVFKWVQSAGRDELLETHDVVVSPPMLSLLPDQNNVIRVVRVSKQPLQAEESYRLLVDELPGAPDAKKYAVSFVLRYSIPVFFASAQVTGEGLQWRVSSTGGETIVDVVNRGNSYQRISALNIQTGGKTLEFGKGLMGYVLANSSNHFVLMRSLGSFKAGQTVQISAEGNDGPIQATAELKSAQ
jgi:fimbrial chaperone protein